ncbi:MAG TPA: hypothetical protein VHI97_01500 [Actinomycetota bacterium]|nr:hypothetical protein [Actinomycetota bacterium]
MPVQGTKKEKRQYEKIKRSAKKSGKYKGREKEVAARTVMKQKSKKKSSSSKKKSSSRKKSSSSRKKK